jgi:hypothetical protein
MILHEIRHFVQFDEKEIGFCLVIRADVIRGFSVVLENFFNIISGT